MKKLLILSGKGGTGKTTTAAAFIRFLDARAFADCDVDAPNLHLVTQLHKPPSAYNFLGSQKAAINPTMCIGCGKCMRSCHFDAIHESDGYFSVDEYTCEGCGVCAYICPQGAAALQDDVSGEVMLYAEESVFVTAELKMGRGNSGKLVSEVKFKLSEAAPKAEFAIIDGAPGIGCPVIASMSGVDMVLIVTEPSVSGISDMERILKTAAIFQTKVAVCVNKYDQSFEHAERIERYCAQQGIPFSGRIPYDPQASAAINAGHSLADIDCPAAHALKKVYQETMKYYLEVNQ